MTFTVRPRHVAVVLVIMLVGAGAYLGGRLSFSHPPRRSASAGTNAHQGRPLRASASSSTGAPGGAGTASGATRSFAALYQADSSGVVRIDATSCSGSDVGTGFLVAPDLVATVAHGVAGAATIGLTADGTTLVGQVIGFDPANDLALVTSSAAFAGHVFSIGPPSRPSGPPWG